MLARPFTECKEDTWYCSRNECLFPGQVEQQGRVPSPANAAAGEGNHKRILALAHERRRPAHPIVDQPFQASGPLVPTSWTAQSIFAE